MHWPCVSRNWVGYWICLLTRAMTVMWCARVEICARPCLYARTRSHAVPWMEANGISIHYELAGAGPSLVLLHEMGGTLASWDGIFPALTRRFRVLRYDQRGSGLSEKPRSPITTELLVDDLEAVLQATALPAPRHFVTVAAATMQALLHMSRHPDGIASFVFCNPFTG